MSNSKADPGQDPKISIDSSFTRVMMYPIEDYDGRQQAPNVAVYPEIMKVRPTMEQIIAELVSRSLARYEAEQRSGTRVRKGILCADYPCCYRCGNESHFADKCFATKNIFGGRIRGRKPVPGY